MQEELNNLATSEDAVPPVKTEGIANMKPITKKPSAAKTWKIVVVVFGLVLLGVIGFLIYHFLTFNHDVLPCEERTCEITETQDEETGETVKIIKVPVGQKDDDVAVRAVADELFNIATNVLCGDNCLPPELVRSYSELGNLYKPEGMKVAVGLDLSYGFHIVRSSEGGTTYDERKVIGGELDKALVQYLTQNGFKEYEYSLQFADSYINEESGIICAKTTATLAYDVACSSVNWYSNIDNWDLLNELAEAYKMKMGEYPTYMAASLDRIENSGYEQYQRISVGFLGAGGLFYRVTPESEWEFFRVGQDAPLCLDYDTDDLKQAFVGTTCWNDQTQEIDTVKP